MANRPENEKNQTKLRVQASKVVNRRTVISPSQKIIREVYVREMTVRNKLFTVLSSFLMVFAVGTFALAQETTTKQEDSSKQDTQKAEKGFGHRGGHGKGGRHGFGKGFGRHGGMRGMRGGFHQLNLSEDQKTQLKTLHETFRVNNKAAFDEMHTLFQ